MVRITLPDNTVLEFEASPTGRQIALRIGERLARAALAVRADGELCDLDARIQNDARVEIVTCKSDPDTALDLMRHSCAHVMAHAICNLYPQTQLVYGPTVENGFYYDLDLDRPLTPDDFADIEAEMEKIAAQDLPFHRYELTRQEALEKLQGEGNRYKIDNAQRANGDVLSFYVTGNADQPDRFEDLCRGPHVPSTSRIGAFKIMSIAGAYFHGDASEKMLQRVYGTAFADKKQLKQYLHQLEEARRRDHRVIGKQLELFSFHEEGPGFAFFHPNGMVVWNEMIDYWRAVHKKWAYQEIRTPIVLNEQLWHKSGHWDNYKENMYFTDIDEQTYAVKPMNCPGGCLVYKNRPHSYRELPLRVAELGLVHRHEASGVLHGLLRVRQFTQDDAHIYCTADQIESEVVGVMKLAFEIYHAFDLADIRLELSTMPQKHIGSEAMWDQATNALKGALASENIPYDLNPGDGAFYGPKIDFHVRDCLGRSWQIGTIQVDFSMPERFDMTYVDRDNTTQRPVMIHRAILGSIERFLGILIEHYGGAFPLWLAPEQVRVLPISEKTNDYARQIHQQLLAANFRCTADLADDKINAKIKRAHGMKLPYMLVVGPAEQENQTVTARIRGQKEQVTLKIDQLIEGLTQTVQQRRMDLALEYPAQ